MYRTWLIEQCQQGRGTASCKIKQRAFSLRTPDMCLNYTCFTDLTQYWLAIMMYNGTSNWSPTVLWSEPRQWQLRLVTQWESQQELQYRSCSSTSSACCVLAWALTCVLPMLNTEGNTLLGSCQQQGSSCFSPWTFNYNQIPSKMHVDLKPYLFLWRLLVYSQLIRENRKILLN